MGIRSLGGKERRRFDPNFNQSISAWLDDSGSVVGHA